MDESKKEILRMILVKQYNRASQVVKPQCSYTLYKQCR